MDDETKTLITEARADYSLEGRLQGLRKREASLTLYTDEIAGDKLGYAKDVKPEKNVIGIVIEDGYRGRSGVLGEIDKLDDVEDTAETRKLRIKLQKQAKELREALASTSITFSLRAVPEIAVKAARRAARKTLGIKGSIPEDVQEDHDEALNAHIHAAVIESYVDHESNQKVSGLTYEDAVTLRHYLPKSQFLRLLLAVNELQFRSAIDDSITDQADFSPAT